MISAGSISAKLEVYITTLVYFFMLCLSREGLFAVSSFKKEGNS